MCHKFVVAVAVCVCLVRPGIGQTIVTLDKDTSTASPSDRWEAPASIGTTRTAPTDMWLNEAPPTIPSRMTSPRSASLLDEFTALLAMDGSKQPQDFGVNANAGLQASMNWGLPMFKELGIGAQIGTNYTATDNAVRVYELLNETTKRNQSFTTVGFFQRTDSGFAWGGVYDFLYEDTYDHFSLGQWRIRGSYLLSETDEIGTTAQLRSVSDNGVWGASTPVTLRSINQGSIYWRRFWKTGAQTTGWIGLADRHSEDNIVTGPAPAKKDSFLFGADILMPLTSSLAIYGETNMITPFDTGTVDAFLGIQWYPRRKAFNARRGQFSPLLPTASPVSFSTDLVQ